MFLLCKNLSALSHREHFERKGGKWCGKKETLDKKFRRIK